MVLYIGKPRTSEDVAGILSHLPPHSDVISYIALSLSRRSDRLSSRILRKKEKKPTFPSSQGDGKSPKDFSPPPFFPPILAI